MSVKVKGSREISKRNQTRIETFKIGKKWVSKTWAKGLQTKTGTTDINTC
jgi:hypothetical protein